MAEHARQCNERFRKREKKRVVPGMQEVTPISAVT